MTMENNNLENNNDDMCEIFDSHEDVVSRVKERIPDENEFTELSEFFKIFGNPTRLKIISLLSIENKNFYTIFPSILFHTLKITMNNTL